MRAEELGVKDIKISTATFSSAALKSIDAAIVAVSSERAKLGAIQNRMEYAVESLATTGENLTAAESRIRDVDMASEMVSFTKENILQQSAMAMLAQANQQPEQILTLLQ
jgi:flagellin